MATWYSVTDQQRIAAAWPGNDAPIENEELLGFILDTARLQVISFAPEATTPEAALSGILLQFGLQDRLEEVLDVLALTDEDVPFNYVFAQLQQAINLWNAGRVTSEGNVGGEMWNFTPRPLDKTIKSIIRPTDGKPSVF